MPITAVVAFPLWPLRFTAGALARRFSTATTRARPVTYGGRVADDLESWPGLAILLAAIALPAADGVQARRRTTTEPTE